MYERDVAVRNEWTKMGWLVRFFFAYSHKKIKRVGTIDWWVNEW